MSMQVVEVLKQVHWHKWIVALVLTAALTGLPVLAEHLPGPLGSLIVQSAHACPVGGSCG